MKIAIGSLLILGILGVSVMSCASFGTRPSEEYKKRFNYSKHFNQEKGVFQNRRPKYMAQKKKEGMNFGVIKDWLSSGVDRTPKSQLPEVHPELKTFLASPEKLKVIWFGHSSFLLNMNGKIVLVDPVFGPSAAPFSFMVKRYQKPAIALKDLPKIDFVLISHDHYDHLDMPTIEFFKGSDTKFITPLGVGSHLKGWGIEENKITERDWWQKFNAGGIEFIATPAQHFSGRDGLHENETLWASWVVRSKDHNVYISGDSGYDTHFKAIGDKYGPFDLAFIECGQYNENWTQVHMMPAQTLEAFKDLKAKKLFPVHWGMFKLAMHTWYDPIEQLTKLAQEKQINLVTPKLGEIVDLSTDTRFERWWEIAKN